MMNVKRELCVMSLVCAVLLVSGLNFIPAFAAALPDDPEPPQEEVDEGLSETPNRFCEAIDVEHPVGSRLAKAFDVPYEEVMGWFCDDEMGFGQIMLALTTAQTSGGDAADLLTRRADGEGWGQIWQDMGLIGRGRVKGNSETDDVVSSEDAGPSEDHGRPEDPGASETHGQSNGVGPGENRGLHLGANKSKEGNNRP